MRQSRWWWRSAPRRFSSSIPRRSPRWSNTTKKTRISSTGSTSNTLMPCAKAAGSRSGTMAKYTPPEQERTMQFVDIAFLVLAIFNALWLPLKLGLAGAAKEIDKIDNPTWENLGQNPTMVAAWEKLVYTPATAYDIIQNHFHYNIDWT